jgi:hypothetical protein
VCAILGAVWEDSGEEHSAVKKVIEHLGLVLADPQDQAMLANQLYLEASVPNHNSMNIFKQLALKT